MDALLGQCNCNTNGVRHGSDADEYNLARSANVGALLPLSPLFVFVFLMARKPQPGWSIYRDYVPKSFTAFNGHLLMFETLFAGRWTSFVSVTPYGNAQFC